MSAIKVGFDLWFAVLGLILGSFLTVVVGRLPEGGSVIFPPSHCPACKTRLSARELVPVFSYLVQGGRCRHCQKPIPLRYLVIELASGLGFFVISVLRLGAPDFFTLLVLWLLAIAVTAIDLEHGIIPNALLLVSGILLLVSLLPSGWPAYVSAVEGGGLLFGMALIIAVAGRGGFGFGDVKYLGVIGVALGPGLGLLALFIAVMAGGVYAAFLLISRQKGRKDTLAFGPFIALASAVTPFLAPAFMTYYRGLV